MLPYLRFRVLREGLQRAAMRVAQRLNAPTHPVAPRILVPQLPCRTGARDDEQNPTMKLHTYYRSQELSSFEPLLKEAFVLLDYMCVGIVAHHLTLWVDEDDEEDLLNGISSWAVFWPILLALWLYRKVV